MKNINIYSVLNKTTLQTPGTAAVAQSDREFTQQAYATAAGMARLRIFEWDEKNKQTNTKDHYTRFQRGEGEVIFSGICLDCF